MNLNDALEQSLAELGLDLEGDTGDLQPVTDEQEADTDDLEGSEEDAPVGEEVQEEAAEEAESEDDAPTGQILEVPKGSTLRLPDGTEVEADKAVLFQSDYTKKTQQLSEERKTLENEKQEFETQRQQVAEAYEQMRNWYESRAANPTDWVKEIISEAKDPTATIAKALYELANDGRLDPDFVKTFGIDSGEVARKASQSQRDRELEELRSKVEARERTEAEQRAIQQQAQRYQQEWDEIKSSHSIAFENSATEIEAKRELLQFALANKISHSLKDAYDLMLVRTGRLNQPKVEPAPTPDPQVTDKKRASRAVTPKSSAGSAPKAKRPKSVRDAALQALDEYVTA